MYNNKHGGKILNYITKGIKATNREIEISARKLKKLKDKKNVKT